MFCVTLLGNEQRAERSGCWARGVDDLLICSCVAWQLREYHGYLAEAVIANITYNRR